MIPSNHLEIEDVHISDDYDYDLDSMEQYRIDLFIDRFNNLNDYERRMAEIYFVNGLSLRQIQKATGIGLNSIHKTIKEVRAIMIKQNT